MKDKKFLVPILVGVIVILMLLVVYAFVVKPAINGYAVKSYNEGVNYALGTIVSQLQTNGYVKIPLSNNQSVLLVPYVPSNSTVG